MEEEIRFVKTMEETRRYYEALENIETKISRDYCLLRSNLYKKIVARGIKPRKPHKIYILTGLLRIIYAQAIGLVRAIRWEKACNDRIAKKNLSLFSKGNMFFVYEDDYQNKEESRYTWPELREKYNIGKAIRIVVPAGRKTNIGIRTKRPQLNDIITSGMIKEARNELWQETKIQVRIMIQLLNGKSKIADDMAGLMREMIIDNLRTGAINKRLTINSINYLMKNGRKDKCVYYAAEGAYWECALSSVQMPIRAIGIVNSCPKDLDSRMMIYRYTNNIRTFEVPSKLIKESVRKKVGKSHVINICFKEQKQSKEISARKVLLLSGLKDSDNEMIRLANYISQQGHKIYLRIHPDTKNKLGKIICKSRLLLDGGSTLDECKIVSSINSSFAAEVINLKNCKIIFYQGSDIYTPKLNKQILEKEGYKVTQKKEEIVDWLGK